MLLNLLNIFRKLIRSIIAIYFLISMEIFHYFRYMLILKRKLKQNKILGIFKVKSKKNVEELKEEISECFKYETNKVYDYLNFIHLQTEKALHPSSKCVLSIHSRNLKCFLKTTSKSIIGESINIQNFNIRPSSESFIEFGLSNNNNILLPLIDAVIENNLPNELNLIKSLNCAISKFNSYIDNFPDYKYYLLNQLRGTSVTCFGAGCPRYSEYIVGLQQTFLKVLKSNRSSNGKRQILDKMRQSSLKLSHDVINRDMFKYIFIESPSFLYYIEYFKQMKDNINFEKKVVKAAVTVQSPSSKFNRSIGSHSSSFANELNNQIKNNSPELIEKQKEWNNTESSIKECMNEILKSKSKELDVNLCIMYSLYTGIKSKFKCEEYTFLLDTIKKTIDDGIKIDNQKIENFMRYIVNSIEQICNSSDDSSGNKINELKIFNRTLSILTPKLNKTWRDYCIDLCMRILSSITKSRIVRHSEYKEAKTLINSPEVHKNEEFGNDEIMKFKSRKYTTADQLSSTPGSPEKLSEFEEFHNLGYSQISVNKSDANIKI